MISRSEDGQELCGLSFLPTAEPLFPHSAVGTLGFSKVITCASGIQTQVSGAPTHPLSPAKMSFSDGDIREAF